MLIGPEGHPSQGAQGNSQATNGICFGAPMGMRFGQGAQEIHCLASGLGIKSLKQEISQQLAGRKAGVFRIVSDLGRMKHSLGALAVTEGNRPLAAVKKRQLQLSPAARWPA